ncbi:MAG: hypothetical protein V7752_11310, partial [Halopseudomonas sp.]
MQPSNAVLLHYLQLFLPARSNNLTFANFFPALILSLVTAIVALPALAISDSSIDQQRQVQQQQRDQYQLALTALEQRDFNQFDNLTQQLNGYPLYPYLLYQGHRKQLDQLNATTLKQFSSDFADTPLPKKLYRTWLNHLVKRKRWQLLLDNYQPKLSNTSLHCSRLWGLHQTGYSKQAFAQVAPLWVKGSSQPKSCDKLFKAWIKSDVFSEQHAWDRFWLALKKNNAGLA